MPAHATPGRPSSSRRRESKLPPRAPDVDERIVMPETRYEILDGKLTYVAPADERHGTHHSKISALLEAYAAPGYEVASDMLTRTSETNDFAPDASVFPSARDPKTGGRRLEELAFEIVSTERLSHAGKKAKQLAERGVRRIFAIDVKRKRALSWSRETGAWEMLDPNGAIDDPALSLPLPIADMVRAAKADDAVARALIAKKNPVIVQHVSRERARAEAKGRAEGQLEGKAEGKLEGKAEGKLEGKLEGAIDALLSVLAGRNIRVPAAAERRIRAAKDEATVSDWLARALRCVDVGDLFPKPRVRARPASPRKTQARKGSGT